MKPFSVCLFLILSASISFAQQSNIRPHSAGGLDSFQVSVADTGLRGMSNRFYMRAQEVTGTRFVKWDKTLSQSYRIPNDGIDIAIMVPAWVTGRIRAAVSYLWNGAVVSNSFLDTLFMVSDMPDLPMIYSNSGSVAVETIFGDGVWKRVRFYLPSADPIRGDSLNGFRFAFSYFSGESGTRVHFMDDVRLISGSDSITIDRGGDVIDVTAPTAPSITLHGATETTLQVSVTAPNDTDVKTLQVNMSTNPSFTDSVVKKLDVFWGGRAVFVFDSLPQNTIRHFRAWVYDSAGNRSVASSVVSGTTLSGEDVVGPAAPKNLSAVAIGSREIKVRYINPQDADLDWVGVYASTDPLFPPFGAFVVFGDTRTPNASDSVVIGNLIPNTTYYFRARGQDTSFNSGEYSETVSAKTLMVTDSNEGNEFPTEFKLYQNYPNPFNPSTVIDFVIAEPGHVLLTVHNVLGEKVATLIDEEMPAGKCGALFDASLHSSGAYVYRLMSGNRTEVRQMLLVR